ncbi:MAG: tetratricopeptide repeat-containing glycosyltransferase family protein [Betaproteobacteria bacterium]|nr:tetratricopeptide repeat-containing glycosyltransferase family protein [Betaproteobacteria bacterium]
MNADFSGIIHAYANQYEFDGTNKGRMKDFSAESHDAVRRLKRKLARAPGDASAWFDLGTAYAATKDHRQAAESFGEAVSLQPRLWEAWAAKGREHHLLRDYPQAFDCYVKALQLNNASPSIRNNLASLLKVLGELRLAEQCLLEAIEIKPDYREAMNNLGNVYREMRRYREAETSLKKSLSLGNDCADVWNNMGLVYKDQMRLDEALTCYERALAFPDYDPSLPFNYAIALLQAGRMQEGWRWYEERWLLEPLRMRRAPYDQQYPEWGGEPLSGKRLVVWSEQGLGDLIQMVRYLPLLKERWPDAEVILRAEDVFQRLFRNLSGMDAFSAKSAGLPAADFHLPAMSFPARFNTMVDTIPNVVPYLRPDPELIAVWRRRLGERSGKWRVGIIWESGAVGVGQTDFDRASRSLSGAELQHLFEGTPFEYVRLQLGGSLDPEDLGITCIDPTPEITDFADTSAIMMNIDCVVSVDTAGAHLAAALGLPTWTLMRFSGGNLFPGTGEEMPWYPNMRLVRQHAPGDWTSAIARLREELLEFAR